MQSPLDRRTRRRGLALGSVVILIALTAGVLYAGYQYKSNNERQMVAVALTGGDPARAPGLVMRYGCGGCHTIPGIPGANGLVGPPLRDIARRVYVAGVVTNTPEHLLKWIVNPRELSSRTAMPVTGISEAEARHVAAYLYAVR